MSTSSLPTAIEDFPLSPNPLPDSQPARAVVSLERGINKLITDAAFHILNTFYGTTERAYARFYVLETIARVPYFSYVSILHLYESFGWWRRIEFLKAHFDESVNETHHLMIMEALGGDRSWMDRFVAQHIAVGYYFFAIFCYLISPRMAYHLSELVEEHAYETYDKFLMSQGELLKTQPAPEVAVSYYNGGNLYRFDGFQVQPDTSRPSPLVESLYDVFVNIRDDEAEHCKTMRACQAVQRGKGLHDVGCSGVVECAVTSSSAADRMPVD
ncbi:hypothetical protein CLOP_g18894 [Closterium sp. NIES-67]|nr:hypothetical protein CLOP_g18894 [Closterium sp. NIES-67]